MVRWIVRIGSLIAASVTLSSVSLAQGTWESGLDLVYQNSKTLHFDGGTNAKLDSDTGLSVTFGYRQTPHIEWMFALDWANVDYTANLVTSPTTSVSAHGSYDSFTPRVNLQYNI